MSDTKKIESVVLNSFAFLHNKHGFKKPIINRDTWSATVSYLSNQIGIEIELDWRDLDMFVLITKLDKGKLPKGYYMWKGKRCRINIEKVLQEKLNVGLSELTKHGRPVGEKKRQKDRHAINERIAFYQALLNKYTGEICEKGLDIFD